MEKLLICNCLGDEASAPISMYLLENKLEEVKAGVNKLAQSEGASVMYLLPEGSNVSGLDAEVSYGACNITTVNPFAVIQVLKGNLARPMIGDDLEPIYEDKKVVLTTPAEAYEAQTGTNSKWVYVIKGDNVDVKEVPVGTKVSEVVDCSGAKAVLLGGMRGTFVLPAQLEDYTVSQESLYDSIKVFSSSDCMVDATVKLTNAIWENSCGKCVLCREGSLQFKTIVGEMTQGKAKVTDIEMLREVAELVKVGAYCPFGQNMPNVLLSAFSLFADEFEEHIKKKSCSAGVCYKAEAIYVIMPDMCVGCGDCIDECDEDAIEGKKGFIHMIDQDMCENCGKCVSACDEGAIVAVTGKLPKLPKKLTKVGKF